MVMPKAGDPCLTCYGSGETVSESGPVACPDCFGEGQVLSRWTKLEWRLRDIDRRYQGSGHEAAADIGWLVHELRRSREALLRVLARCQDDDSDPALRDVKFEANDALGLYEPR